MYIIADVSLPGTFEAVFLSIGASPSLYQKPPEGTTFMSSEKAVTKSVEAPVACWPTAKG